MVEKSEPLDFQGVFFLALSKALSKYFFKLHFFALGLPVLGLPLFGLKVGLQISLQYIFFVCHLFISNFVWHVGHTLFI